MKPDENESLGTSTVRVNRVTAGAGEQEGTQATRKNVDVSQKSIRIKAGGRGIETRVYGPPRARCFASRSCRMLTQQRAPRDLNSEGRSRSSPVLAEPEGM